MAFLFQLPIQGIAPFFLGPAGCVRFATAEVLEEWDMPALLLWLCSFFVRLLWLGVRELLIAIDKVRVLSCW